MLSYTIFCLSSDLQFIKLLCLSLLYCDSETDMCAYQTVSQLFMVYKLHILFVYVSWSYYYDLQFISFKFDNMVQYLFCWFIRTQYMVPPSLISDVEYLSLKVWCKMPQLKGQYSTSWRGQKIRVKKSAPHSEKPIF